MDKKDQFEFLDSGFNSISTVVVITDRHWQIMMANPSAKKLFRQRLGTQQPENLRPLFGHTSFLDNVSERIAADEMVDFLLCNDQFQPDTSNPVWMVNFDPIDSEKSPFNFRVITIVDFKVLGEEIKRRREAEAEFRAVFDNAFHFLALLDPDGRIIQANRTALKLLEVPEDMNLVGSKFVESPFFFQQDSQKIREAVDSALKDNIYRGVLTVHSLSGRLIYVDSVFYSIRNRDHEVQYILAEGVDVTDRLAAEQEQEKLRSQVQHSQKLESLGILAGGIAHDFNNLLMGILGHADLASLKVPPSSPALNNLHEIESTARRAADLCRQMLAYSGKGKFVVEAIDLNLIIADMRQLLAVSVNKSSTLKYHLSEELPLMEGDASQIGQIILNLVMNASEAIGQKDGIITIATGAKYCDQSFFESN